MDEIEASNVVHLYISDGEIGGPPRPPGGDSGQGDPKPVWLSDDFLAQTLSDRVLCDDWLYCSVWKQ